MSHTITINDIRILRGAGDPGTLDRGRPALDETNNILRIGTLSGTNAAFRDAVYNAATFSPIAGSSSITTVGTITSGTWHGTAIGVGYGGTGLATIAAGAILYASALDTLAALAANSTGTRKFLRQVSSGAPAWDTLVAGDIPDLSATYQPLDSDLTALAGVSSTGVLARTGSGTAAARTITGTSNQIAVTNGDGVSGNPTIAFVTSPVMPSGTTGTTQSPSDNSTKLATTAYVDAAVAAGGGGSTTATIWDIDLGTY